MDLSRSRGTSRFSDLTDIPEVPSIFEPVSDSAEFDPRRPLRFLFGFARDVTKPVTRDNKIHIDYVPTQVLTEYLRHRSSDQTNRSDGVKYSSSKIQDGQNIVIFATREDIIGVPSGYSDHEPWIEFAGHSIRSTSAAEMERWTQPRDFFLLDWDEWDEDAEES